MPTLNTRSPGEPYLIERNAGYFEYQLPVSLKAVINWKGKVPLLRNERDEWELPGGKLEPGEEPAACLAREIREELAWDAASSITAISPVPSIVRAAPLRTRAIYGPAVTPRRCARSRRPRNAGPAVKVP